MADSIRATPQNAPLGVLARALQAAHEFGSRPFGYDNPPVRLLSEMVGIPALGRTVERMSYGQPVTNVGKANVPLLPDDTADAAMLAVPPLAGLARRVGTNLVQTAPYVARDIAQSMTAPTRSYVIKPKGGNWIAGGVEDAMQQLKRQSTDPAMVEVLRNADPRFVDQNALGSLVKQDAALNKWLDTKLQKYIRNEMATPEDPLRLQADAFAVKQAEMLAAKDAQIEKAVADMERARQARGFTPEMMTQSQARIRELRKERNFIAEQTGLHAVPEPYGSYTREELRHIREMEGFPGQGMGTSDAARRWEATADMEAGLDAASAYKYAQEQNPWLAKVDPNSPVYDFGSRGARNLGFDHLVDELKNAMRPDTDLPEKLRLKPEDLDKMTVPRAAKLVDEINAWRAGQAAEANAARAGNAATVLHKEYPEQGLKWVELRKPEQFEGDEITGKLGEEYGRLSPEGQRVVREDFLKQRGIAALDDALKYEGEMMQHCVGGYCPDVAEGRSRIFSLRDENGKPYVTIETAPNQYAPRWENVKKYLDQAREQVVKDRVANNLPLTDQYENEIERLVEATAVEMAKKNSPENIVQIKGPRNRAPDEKYLPFVQDFVKSGRWSDVGDPQNAGLRKYTDVFNVNEQRAIERAGGEVPDNLYLSGSDIQRLHDLITPEGKRLKYDAKGRIVGGEEASGYAGGGLVGLAAKYDKGGKVRPGEGLPDPSLLNLSLYADTVSREMFPGERENPQRDAARHMLASALAAQKTNPTIADLMGKAHEFKEAPFRTAGHWLGLSEPRADYRTDIHNNALGITLGADKRSLRELLDAVEAYARAGTPTRQPGRASLEPDADTRYAEGGLVDPEGEDQQGVDRMVRLEQGGPAYAQGGLVQYDPQEIDTLVSQLKEEFHG